MTIDERLEALAMHLELLTRVHQDYEKKADKRHEELAGLVAQTTAQTNALAMHLELLTRVHEDYEKKADKRQEEFVRQMTSYAADVKDSITRLTNIAAAHDTRLDDHEDRISDLEDK